MISKLTVQEFANKDAFNRGIEFFHQNQNSLDVENSSDSPILILKPVCIQQDDQRLTRLSQFCFQLLNSNQKFLDASNQTVMSLIHTFDPYDPEHRLTKISNQLHQYHAETMQKLNSADVPPSSHIDLQPSQHILDIEPLRPDEIEKNSNAHQVLGQMIKKQISENPSACQFLNAPLLNWILSDNVAKEKGELEYLLGICSVYGKETEQSDARAFVLFMKAADLGFPPAYIHLGHCYWHGRGVKQNHVEAFALYTQAVKLGCLQAYIDLSDCYWHGRGAEQNDAEAYALCAKAAALGCPQAYMHLGICYFTGRGVEQNEAEAFALYTKAAKLGCAEAYIELGDCYFTGRGAEQSYAEAFALYTKAAKLGCPQAYVDLGNCYLAGRGTEQSDTEAFAFYTKAANLGCPQAYVKLGNCYCDGRGTEKNDTNSFVSWEKGMSLGNETCKFLVANCLITGKGTPKNLPRAQKLLEELIAVDFPEAAELHSKHFV